ncbi:hypothetical protein GIB67_018413 [Kingdonia uniflora]|uniref:Uncharacterized protein n=1 Tax=Kingdonia uniflora TaxID=39325 RepID=A0A7J7MJB9_9MAGN|nr:hypothetical protein GIB67_018413 [Kingdonia uniflora]
MFRFSLQPTLCFMHSCYRSCSRRKNDHDLFETFTGKPVKALLWALQILSELFP